MRTGISISEIPLCSKSNLNCSKYDTPAAPGNEISNQFIEELINLKDILNNK
jgi:hypothetical protein